MFEKIERYLFMSLLFVIVGVTGIFCKRILDLRKEQMQFVRLAEQVKTVRDDTEIMEYEYSGKKDMFPEYKELWERNKDLAGWISIDETGIDYPVICFDSLWEHRRFYVFSVMYAREQDWMEPEGLFYQRKLETKTEKAEFFKRLHKAT